MEIDFNNKHLLDLYTKGKSKKMPLPEGIAEKYVDRVNRIEAAETINDLRVPPSMKFKRMKVAANRYSIRLNDQYRLEFDINFIDKEKTKGKVVIVNVSKHYKK